MHWLVDAVREEASVEFKDLKLAKSTELGLSSDATVGKIAMTLFCASQDPDGAPKGCANFVTLVKNQVIVLQDDEKKRLYLGYSFFINRPQLSPEHFRNIIYDRAQKAWKVMLPLVSKHLDYEQFHVGFGPGGSVAHLIAHRMLTTSALPFVAMTKNNDLNQVKVVTVRAAPIFTEDVTSDPIGPANHAAFIMDKKAIPGYRSFGTKILLPNYKVEKSKLEVPLERLALFSTHETAAIRLRAMREEQRKDYRDAVLRQLEIVDMVASDLINAFSGKAFSLYGQDQTTCASSIAEALEKFLPHDRHSMIFCNVRNSGDKANRKEFTVRCVLKEKDDDKEAFHLASYRAHLALFSRQDEACKKLEGAGAPKEKWSTCLRDIVVNNDELSLISPYAGDDSGNCKFIPNLRRPDWARRPVGCVVKPVALDDALYHMYDTAPNLFHSLIPDDSIFPDSCLSVIKPLYFQKDAKHSAESLFEVVADYFGEMTYHRHKGSRLAKKSNLPTLFVEHDTKTYHTKSLTFSSGMFVADDEVDRKLRRCIASRHTKFLDCTVPVNQWIPDACPSFCATDKSNKLCETMTFCASINAFISVFSIYAPQVRTAIAASARKALKESDIAQYALYDFTKRSIIEFYGITVGLFFTKLPELSKPSAKSGQKTKTRGAVDSDERW
jgi:hypothetical protein